MVFTAFAWIGFPVKSAHAQSRICVHHGDSSSAIQWLYEAHCREADVRLSTDTQRALRVRRHRKNSRIHSPKAYARPAPQTPEKADEPDKAQHPVRAQQRTRGRASQGPDDEGQVAWTDQHGQASPEVAGAVVSNGATACGTTRQAMYSCEIANSSCFTCRR